MDLFTKIMVDLSPHIHKLELEDARAQHNWFKKYMGFKGDKMMVSEELTGKEYAEYAKKYKLDLRYLDQDLRKAFRLNPKLVEERT